MRAALDPYLYLLLSLFFFVLVAIIFVFRKDLRKRIIRLGIVGAFLGPLSEVWYWVDYWQPPSILHIDRYGIEDVIVGAAVTALSATLYEAITGRKTAQVDKRRYPSFIFLFILCLVVLLYVANYLGYNSALVSIALFFFAAFFMIARRRDLFLPSLLSGVFLTIVAIPIYFVLFELVDPMFWRDHWLLFGSPYGWIIGDGFPISEMLWYLSWGMNAGIATHYIHGTVPKVPEANGVQFFALMLKRGLGALCIILGVGALVTPFTPGAWLIIVGMELLGLSFLIPERFRKQFKDMRKKIFKR